ncbi:hypothetical protein [Halobacterium litoreum]|uniref:Uncharacterized protein n=1 Tax=Halobacterium litoreum TaxID=2039234 RepID=A0ABD5NC38_9EURY|nr:hypothetical protein [Halobacterium litoreum]UHH14564.1 hypothetical protein LT972_06075 [Halobacterium litoreum]
MSDTSRRRSKLAAVGQALVKPTVRFVLALAVLFTARAVLVRVPGADRILLEPTLSVALLVYGLVTLVIMAAVFDYASTVGAVIAAELDGPSAIRRAIQLATLLLLLVWAYPTFTWLPYFDTHPGQYELVFLVTGLVAGGWLVVLLYTNLDEFADLVASELTTATPAFSPDAEPSETDTTTEETETETRDQHASRDATDDSP